MRWPGGGPGGATAEPHPILNESLAAIPKADGIDHAGITWHQHAVGHGVAAARVEENLNHNSRQPASKLDVRRENRSEKRGFAYT
jgi:hypothetical protein